MSPPGTKEEEEKKRSGTFKPCCKPDACQPSADPVTGVTRAPLPAPLCADTKPNEVHAYQLNINIRVERFLSWKNRQLRRPRPKR